MAINLPASITGAPQTGLTTPGYTCTVDYAPDSNGKMVSVTAVTGTQPGVVAASASSPFSLNWVRPKVMKILQAVVGQNRPLMNVPKNRWLLHTRKGVTVMSGQPVQIMDIRTEISIPAGADTVDPANVRAALSAHFGYGTQLSAAIGDTVITGIS